MKYKNSEGYADSTAGIAIGNASKSKRKRQKGIRHLTFMIGELSSFGEWIAELEQILNEREWRHESTEIFRKPVFDKEGDCTASGVKAIFSGKGLIYYCTSKS